MELSADILDGLQILGDEVRINDTRFQLILHKIIGNILLDNTIDDLEGLLLWKLSIIINYGMFMERPYISDLHHQLRIYIFYFLFLY